MNEIKIGLIGCGKQAPKHISGLRKIPGVQLVLADVDPDCAKQLAEREGLAWVDDPGQIAADPSIRAVDICTPTPHHAPLIRMAVESGKDFFVEKPLCSSLDEARELDTLVAAHGRIGMVGYIYRFAPVFDFGRTIFEETPCSGESMVLGRVVSAVFRLGGRGSHQVWKHRSETGGGAINEMLVHMLDLAIWYFGPPAELEVMACDLLRPRREIQGEMIDCDAEDYVVVRIKSESGVEVLCQADLVTPVFTQFAEVQGENGTFMGSIQPEMPSFLFCSREVAGYTAGKTGLKFGPRNFFEAQMAEFVKAIRSGQQPSRCTLHDSIQLMGALEKIRNGTHDA